jgi:hypothetical protein
MSVTSMPKVIHYDTLESFAAVDGLHLSLIRAEGEEDGFLQGPPCLHLVLNAPDGAYERVFTVEPAHEDLARAIGHGMTLAYRLHAPNGRPRQFRRLLPPLRLNASLSHSPRGCRPRGTEKRTASHAQPDPAFSDRNGYQQP